eukprot:TRINITY_DN13730_c0_g2_i2.p1 TRINITY_DN13730_c0_g2~~TRINITY_DN13730_c0_g2_i2.p1  ORF type:complete len:642 (-),score=119.66 TRINITY_DN13730_c0_g2_i2:13-1938(-)
MMPKAKSPGSANSTGMSTISTEDNTAQNKRRRSMEDMLDRLTAEMDAETSDWSPTRKFLFKAIHSWSFETAIGIQIMANLVIAVYETDQMSMGDSPAWVYWVNLVMFSIYALEVALRIFVYRREFFTGIFNWNTFDMILIGTDLLTLFINAFVGGLDQSAMVRCLRVLRALRVITAIRIWPAFRELYIMLHSLIGALRAMLWSTVLLGLILILFSVMAVEMLQPLAEEIAKKDGFGDCERCPEAFRTVWSSAITFFQQIVAGDSWGQVSIPIMEQYPHTTPFFIIVLVIIQFGILNLVLVAIVDQAHKASEDDAQLQARSRKEAFEHQKKTLYHVCRSLDEDHSGDLGIEELTKGFRSNPELANHLKFLDVSLADVQILFNVLDDDGSGTVNYEEFVEQLFKMQNQDTGILLAFLKNYVQDIRGKVGVHTETLESLTQSVHDIKRMLRTLTDQPKQAEVLSSKKDLDEALVVTKNPEESAHQTFGSLEQADMVLEETKAVEESARRSKLLQRSSSEMEKEFELLLQKCCESVSSKMLEHLQRAAKDTVTEWSSSIHSLEQMSMQPCKQAAVSESSVQASTVCSSSGSAESSYLGTEQQYGGAFAVSAFGDTGAGPEAPSELCLPAPSETAFGVPASEISTL